MTGVLEQIALGNSTAMTAKNDMKALQSQRPFGLEKDSIWACIQSSKYSDEPFARVFTITVEIAQQLLERNDSNRSISKTKVREYARDIVRGDFLSLNGQTIVITDDGSLIDGQHRLAAIVECGEPVKMLVVFGVDHAVQKSIDQGKRRTLADRFKMAGIDDPAAASSVANICQAFDIKGLRGETTGLRKHGHGNVRTNAARETDAVLLSYGMENIDVIRFALSIVPSRGTKQLGGRVRLAASLFLIAREIHPTQWATVEGFFRQIVKTTDNTSGYVPYEIRKRLIGESESGHISHYAYLELVFRAWNAWAQGKRQTSFQVLGVMPRIKNL